MAPRSSETGAVAGAYALGQPVLRTRDGERMVGRVVGSASSSVGVLYEVEFATAIEKALFAHELEPAATSDIQAALSMVASSAWTELPTVGNGHESARQAFVQAQYATMLNELLAWGAPPSAECGNHSSGLYAPGDSVAIREGDAWVLDTITGVRWRGEQASYTMETMDGMNSVTRKKVTPRSRGVVSATASSRASTVGRQMVTTTHMTLFFSAAQNWPSWMMLV